MRTRYFKSTFYFIALISLLISLIEGAMLTTPAHALTLIVSNTNDSGAGSLRQALLNANNGDVIDATGITGTIMLASELVVADDVTINGPGETKLAVSGNNLVRVFTINPGKTVAINNLTIQNGLTAGNGGGVFNQGILALNHVNISNNGVGGAASGGGIYSGSGSSLTVTNSTINKNSAKTRGGGIYVEGASINLDNVSISMNKVVNFAGTGGGIAIENSPSAFLNNVNINNNLVESHGGGLYSNVSLTLTNSLVETNYASTSQSQTSSGGGLAFTGTNQTYNLTNVTIVFNYASSASGDGRGGGIALWSGTLNLTNVTLASNSANTGGGTWRDFASGKIINLRNTIFSSNHAISGAVPNDCSGDINSLGYNLIKNVTCTITGNTTGNLTGVDPMLGTFADNGGPTQTMALLKGSPAINAGTNTGCPATDQRGVTRPFGPKCDIGAYEVNNGVATFRSSGAQDGWVLESGENTNKGGTLNASAATLRLGDDPAKKQYRSILSFTTKTLPDKAVITKVTLKVKKQGITGGGNPVTLFQGFMADIKKGLFGTAALQAADFQTAASKSYGPFKPALANGWYSINLTTGKAYINKLATNGGVTQIRLRFKLDDNNDSIANYLSLYSGNAPFASRPQLIIEYYVP